MQMNYKKIRCACPKSKKKISKCIKEFRTVKRIKYFVKNNECNEIATKKRIRCGKYE